MSSFRSSPAACPRRGINGCVPQYLPAALIAAAILSGSLLSGCAPIWDSPPTKNGAGVGAAAGAVVGAVVGAGVGAVAGNTEAGLAVGTLSGAAIGAYVGNEAQKEANAKGNSEDLKNQEKELDLQEKNINEQKNNLHDASAGSTSRTASAGKPGYEHVQGSYLGSSGTVSGASGSGASGSGASGVTVVSPSSRNGGSPAIRSGQSAGGRVYINPPSTYASASSTAGKVSGGQQYAALASKSSTDGISAAGKPIKRIPAPPLERRPNTSPPAPALPAGTAHLNGANGGAIVETNKSVLPAANTGSILPPPAADAKDREGLPKLDVDDGTVKALEADGASDRSGENAGEITGEDDVLGSVAEPIEGPDQPRARLNDAASAPQTVAGLPPPKREDGETVQTEQAGAAMNSKLLPAAGESKTGGNGLAKTLPEPEKEVIGSTLHSAPESSVGSPVKAGAAPQVLTGTSECKQASAEVQRAKSSVSDADRLFYYRRAVRLCSGEPTYHVEIGKLYINLGRTEDAKFEFRQAIDLDPSNQPAREQLGKLESGGGKL